MGVMEHRQIINMVTLASAHSSNIEQGHEVQVQGVVNRTFIHKHSLDSIEGAESIYV